MAGRQKRQLTFLLLGIFSLHLALPLILTLSVIFVKLSQQRVINNNAENTALFSRFSLEDIGGSIDPGEQEFSYNGMRFDIKSEKTENGKTIIYALADKKETQLDKVNSKQLESSDSVDNSTLKAFPFLFLYFETPSNGLVLSVPGHGKTYTLYTITVSEEFVGQSEQPPWC